LITTRGATEATPEPAGGTAANDHAGQPPSSQADPKKAGLAGFHPEALSTITRQASVSRPD
jgi:hypothetical protein